MVVGTAVPGPWFLIVTESTMGSPAPAFCGVVNAVTTRSDGLFGVADASLESPLSPTVFVADTT